MVADTIPLKNDAPRTRAVRSLKQWIADGSLPVGEPLPSERALSERLNIDRGTLRRALTVLQQDGYLDARSRRTRLVCLPASATQSSLSNTVVVIARFHGNSITQLGPEHRGSGWEIHTPHSVVERLQAKQLFALIMHSDNADEEALRRVAANRPLGVVIADPNSPNRVETARLLQELGVPVAVYGGSPELNEFDRVSSDHDAGSYQLTRWMIERGRKRIQNVWCGPLTNYWYRGRWSGYERAMTEAGLEPLPPIETPPFPVDAPDKRDFENAARHLAGYLVEPLTAKDPVDALLVGTDRDVFGTAAACRFFGKEPNRDVWLAGYDNYWNECSELRFELAGPLITADKRNIEIGSRLVELLLQRAHGELCEEPCNDVVAPKVVESKPILDVATLTPEMSVNTMDDLRHSMSTHITA